MLSHDLLELLDLHDRLTDVDVFSPGRMDTGVQGHREIVLRVLRVLRVLGAKSGLPSRAEITDAAMAQRAEGVMLNKGPFIADAIAELSEILSRMEGHSDKKRDMLRRLGSWAL